MKLRRNRRFHGTVRPRIRQSWNKVNLFNLRRNFNPPKLIFRTFFQQKWIAKTLTRGYHGEHIKERKWERMFSRRLPAVVDMDPRYMARFDGSEQAAGRGSGRQVAPADATARRAEASTGHAELALRNLDQVEVPPWEAGSNAKSDRLTPYMQMTFAPMERRLDIAVFRSMFASSARQARQFVVHGAVTVNGKKMIYPGYLLNPGDLFQVDVERVLYATGAKKATRPAAERAALAKAAEEEEAQGEDGEENAPAAAAGPSDAARRRASRELPYLAARAKFLLSTARDELTLKKKKELREFVRDARRWLAKAGVDVDAADKVPTPFSASASSSSSSSPFSSAPLSSSSSASSPFSSSSSSSPSSAQRPSRPRNPLPPSSKILDKLADLLAAMPSPSAAADAGGAVVSSSTPATDDNSNDTAAITTATQQGKTKAPSKKAIPQLTRDERRLFQKLITSDAENPKDPSKPYATPWRPRPYMQAFAFIPRYLEVNQNICAAVYLRHPVARPGLAEVPSPYPREINQLAFNWYLRRH